MLTALYSAATGMKAQEVNQDLIANNIANINTTSFKKVKANFQDLLYQRLAPSGAVDAESNRTPTETVVGVGVRLVNTQRDFSQGRLEPTGSFTDLAIDGPGFFQIQVPDGVGRGGYGYSRDGNFYIDANGQLVTSQGYKVQPNLTFPTDYLPDTVAVTADGMVSVNTPGGGGAATQIGQIELAFFTNPEGLQSLGGNLYIETDASGSPTTGTPGTTALGTLVQKYLESSNVDLVDELVQMIKTQRAFEFNSQSIKTADEMLQVLSTLRR
jgi:flagellar basal-body rod protein FlgG